MGIVIDTLLSTRNTHQTQQLNRLLTSLLRRHGLVQENSFNDLAADRVDGRKGTHRLLKDHGDILATDLTNLSSSRADFGDVDQVMTVGRARYARAVKEDFSRVD